MKHKNIKLLKSRFHITVCLYESVKQLQEATKENSVAGLYHPEPYVIYPKTKISSKLGTIHLAKERLGVGYISHEVLHAIFDYSEKKGMDTINTQKNHKWMEELCMQQGYLVKEICNWLNDKKLWE